MTKEEKLRKALEKWVESHKDGKNRIIEDCYSEGTLIVTKSTDIDIYSPICYKHKPDWLEADYKVLIGYIDDSNDRFLVLQNSEHSIFVSPPHLDGFDDVERIPIEEIPEEMLDEMLSVKDFEPIATMTVPNPMPKKEINPQYKEYKKPVWKRRLGDIVFALSLIALGVSLIALIVKLC